MKIFHLSLVSILLTVMVTVCFPQESKLKTYGFFDLELETSNKDEAGKRWTFDQHHFNVVTIYHLSDRFRMFGEIEWEHGIVLKSGSGSGMVAVERAWVEYRYSDRLRIKLGKFLPPFGIYNLRHDATPTYLSSFLPSSIYGKHKNTVGAKQRLFAKFATGVQVLGTLFTNEWEGEYYAYFGNGRGADPGEKDDNANKGIGGRVVLSPPIEGLRFGASYYSDKNGEASNTEQTTIAFDAAINRSNFLLEAEFFAPKIEKVDTTSVPIGDFQTANGYYVQGAYTLFTKLTPFAQYNFFDPDIDSRGDDEKDIVFGLNLSVTPRVYLKSEIHFLRFKNPNIKDYEMFVSSIAVAF